MLSADNLCLDPNLVRQNLKTDLDPDGIPERIFEKRLFKKETADNKIFLKYLFFKVDFVKISRRQKCCKITQ